MPLKEIRNTLIAATLVLLMLPPLGASAGNCVPSNGTTCYAYDELNRLTRVDYPDGTYIQYTYDKLGNIKSKVSYSTHLAPTCQTGYNYNATTNTCLKFASSPTSCPYPDGYHENWYIYDSSTTFSHDGNYCYCVHEDWLCEGEFGPSYSTIMSQDYCYQSSRQPLSSSCPSGTVSYNSDCYYQTTATCPSGYALNASTDTCVQTVAPSCGSGYTYNSTTNTCLKFASSPVASCPYPDGYHEDWYIYDSSTTFSHDANYCYCVHDDWLCEGEFGPSYSTITSQDYCYQYSKQPPSSSCPAGTVSNSSDCYYQATATCPSGYALNASTDRCEAY